MIGLSFLWHSLASAALPPDEWKKMRRSGYSATAIDRFINLDRSSAAGITQGGHTLPATEDAVKKISHIDLISQITIIGNGIWFSAEWREWETPPKRVVVVDPNRLVLSEGEYKRTRNKVSFYRIIDSAVPLQSTIPLFAVPKLRLAELAYHPKFSRENKKRIVQRGIDDDPRIGRITGTYTDKKGQQKLTCRWELEGFTAKPFTNLAIFNEDLNFVQAVIICSEHPLKEGYPLEPVYGTILNPKKGDYVLPLATAKELCGAQGRLLFQSPQKPLKVVNLFGAPSTSPVMPQVSGSFPEWLFPGLYRFGVSRGNKGHGPCTQFTEILVQPEITGMVDFETFREILPRNRKRRYPRKRQQEKHSQTEPIHLLIKRFAVRYYRQ